MIHAQETLDGEILVDSFAGGGGASTGIELALGKIVNIAINHDPDAILMHRTNHPYTEHYQESVWDVWPEDVCRGRPVALCWFSPDCKHFSKAKGGALRDRKIRGLAWIALRWAGTVRPRVIILENVEEFVTWGPVRKGKPVKKKAGETFNKFITQLKDLGYSVEYRELVAADYGAPTSRKRFVLIARCDGKPIVWPERTHAPADHPDTLAGKYRPWRSAAEIIDWTLPCPSIFATREEIKAEYGLKAQRPLRPNTLRRIIRGTDKFTIKSGRPFLVQVNHAGGDRSQTLDEPIPTISSHHGFGVVQPVFSPYTVTNTSNSVGAPASQPVHTITSAGNQMLVMPHLVQYHTERGGEGPRGQTVDRPLNTVDGSNRYGLAACYLTEYYGNGQPIDLRGPLHTVTARDREALTVVHVVEFKGQDIGQRADRPLRTITASAGEFAVCKVHLCKIKPGEDFGNWPKIRALLNQYCDYDLADDEILVLEIGHTLYYIADIGLRMLCARELYAAMGFPPDYIIEYDYTGKAYPKDAQVARCGNAVSPPMARAVVAANFPEYAIVDITTMAQLMQMVAV